jgi:hypothetical protein
MYACVTSSISDGFGSQYGFMELKYKYEYRYTDTWKDVL